MRRATYAAVATAGLLIAVKFAGYLLTDAVSLLSALVDSFLDAVASLVNLFAVRHALIPADAEHRFGHGKAEPLAGLGQATFIAGSAVLLLFEAGKRLIEPEAVGNTRIGVGVMVFSMLATALLIAYQRHVVRRTKSVAIEADSLHYVTDLLTSAGVIAALLLTTELGWWLADPLFGAAIGGTVLYTAWRIVNRSLDMLMDRELPDEDRRRVAAIALTHPEVQRVRTLRSRSAGQHSFIELSLEMDGNMPLHTAHDAAEAVEAEIKKEFPGAQVIIHQEPVGYHAAADPAGSARARAVASHPEA